LRHGGGDQTLSELLVASAARLIATRGTVGLTVREIATEAGLAHGVLYNHFADKEELIAQALHAYVQSVMHTVDLPAAGTSTVEQNLREYITFGLTTLGLILPAFGGVIGQPKIMARFAEHASAEMSGGIPDLVGNYLKAEQKLGRIASEADVDAAAVLIVGACHQEVLPGLFRGLPTTTPPARPAFVNALVETVLKGIAVR
jgi:AcrR family transcriptional regulator